MKHVHDRARSTEVLLWVVALVAVAFAVCVVGVLSSKATERDLGYDTAMVPPYFLDVEVTKVYDGDTITVNLGPAVPAIFGEKIGVRIWGIDTPEIRGKCAKERALAIKARDVLRGYLDNGGSVTLDRVERGKYFRIVARVLVGGVDVATELIGQGLAVPYYGGTKEPDYWCQE